MQLFGCGGGGGDSTAPTSLIYSGNTNAAVITLDNAPTLVGNVLYGGTTGTNIPVAVTLTEQTTTRSAGVEVQSEILQNISQHIRDSIFTNNTSLPDLIVGVDLNEPLECDSGSGNLTGTLNDSTFTGTLTFTYINCLLDGITYNGTGTFRIDTFDLNYIVPTDVTMTFTLMSISSSEFTGSMSGTIRIQSMIVSNTEKMTLNYVSKDNLTGKMYKFENMIITSVYDYIFGPTNLTQTYTGTPARVYDSSFGYVGVDTLAPLVFSSVMLTYPDIDGVIIFMGVAGSSIRVTILSSEHIQLELDIDGSPGYEVLRFLLWDELKINADTNITDTDNDGMHDSWEILYGLDFTIDDSAGDLDNDGFSNYQEYLNGTDPSLPTAVNLSNGIQYTTNNIRVGRTEIGDINGDGLNDALTMESGGFGQRLLFYYQNSSNAFDAPIIGSLPDTLIRSFTLGDVNDDGATDVIVSGVSASATSGYLGRIVILYQDPVTGMLSFPGTEIVVSSNSVGSVVVADLNSDGRKDIAVLGSWEQTPVMGNIAIFYQNSNGTLATEFVYDATPVTFIGELHAADMDSDGDNDLILQTAPLQLAVIKQDETQSPPIMSLSPEYYSVQTSYWPSFDAFSIGDLNNDGRTDIAVLDPGNNGFLNLFYQNTNGTLDGPSLITLNTSAFGLEIADIDNNGLNEILGETSGLVFVHAQTSNPPFSDYATYSFQTSSFGGSSIHDALSVGDVTGDGLKDVVVTWSDEGLYVLPAILP